MLAVTGDSNNEVTKSNTHRVTNVLLSVTITKLLMLLTLILLPSQEHLH